MVISREGRGCLGWGQMSPTFAWMPSPPALPSPTARIHSCPEVIRVGICTCIHAYPGCGCPLHQRTAACRVAIRPQTQASSSTSLILPRVSAPHRPRPPDRVYAYHCHNSFTDRPNDAQPTRPDLTPPPVTSLERLLSR